jgi:DNA-binding response OmpR family regulator
MQPYRILLVDDDQELQQLVCILLSKLSVEVVPVGDGKQALEAWKRWPFDLMLLDISMPVMDGFETLRRLRQETDGPVILLTAKDREIDKIKAFEAGANDYIVKPFLHGEFQARVMAALRHSRKPEAPVERLEFGGLAIDLKSRRVFCNGDEMEVSTLEFGLLQCFMQQPGVVFSKTELLKKVWGYQGVLTDTNLVEVQVGRLRKKLKAQPDCPDYIKTIRGAGYRFGT